MSVALQLLENKITANKCNEFKRAKLRTTTNNNNNNNAQQHLFKLLLA